MPIARTLNAGYRRASTFRWHCHEVPVGGGTGTAVVYPAASTLRDEVAMSGQRLLAASGQIPMAARRRLVRGSDQRESVAGGNERQRPSMPSRR